METKSTPAAPSPNTGRYRSLSRTGKFNVTQVGVRKAWGSDLYHSMLALTWPRFLAIVLLGYFSVNLIFASAYFWCGPDALTGLPEASASRFLHSYFFSVQTIATIGYGRIAPVSFAANVLVTVESLLGLLSVALATGVFYARFARPTSRVLFSHWALIQPHDGVPSLVFRLVNQRRNQLIEARLHVVLVRRETTVEGESYRTFYDLKLERDYSAILPVSWTVVHPIDKNSPLHGKSAQDLMTDNTEIFISMNGVDETFSQTVYSRFSYIPEEILWNYRFADILERRDDGVLQVLIHRMHDVEPI